MDLSNPKSGSPDSKKEQSFLNTIRNFTDPREVIREAISNAFDWNFKNISISIWKDYEREKELVIKIRDDGDGLTPVRFSAFWNLAEPSGIEKDKYGRKKGDKISEFGYGTKTYWKCRELVVESTSKHPDGYFWHVLGWMVEPINTLMKEHKLADYYYVDEKLNQLTPTFTEITIKGFHILGEEEFRHEVLKDYILWFTKFGSVESQFDISKNQDKLLVLQGLGASEPETLKFGHIFSPLANNVKSLKTKYKDSWDKNYVNKWVFKSVNIKDYPDSKLDMIFYIEGLSAKRRTNEMLTAPGREPQRWRYSVGDRYGIYVCKDNIPLPPTERINDWISPGKNEWTLYHAFVNCQDFQLTDNRASIGATDRHFLLSVKETVGGLYKSMIKNSPEYKVFQDEIDSTNRQSKGEAKESDEKEDIDKRYFYAKKKHVAEYHCTKRPIITLHEPKQEVEVLTLFSVVKAIEPDIFGFKIIDYSTGRGIDALCVLETGQGGLQKGNLRYVEFKKSLTNEFNNHTFSNLTAVVCWDCNLINGEKVTDFTNKERTLCITKSKDCTTFTLLASPELALTPIKVYVLKQYLSEMLKVNFDLPSNPTN